MQGSRRLVAWAASIAVHVVVVAIVSRTTWLVVETEQRAAPTVVWLDDWRMPEPRRRTQAAERTESAEIQEAVSAAEATEPDTDAAERAEPGAGNGAVEREADANEVRGEPEAPAATESAIGETIDPEPAAASIAPGENRRSRNYIVPEIDWDEVRRRAVEQTSEQLARAESYRTFSLSDVIEQPLPEEPGGSVSDIFDAPSGGAGRAFLTPGRSGGPVGRKITALCDVLGGMGISLGPFMLGSICAEAETYSYFAHLKPAYMRARPVCTENPVAEAPEIDGPGDPTVKCRLVVGDELAMPEDMAVETALERRTP